MSALLAAADPARGAAIADLVGATVIAVVLGLVVLELAVAYRRGGVAPLRRLAAYSERVTGQPAWAALPATVVTSALGLASFGFYWDVAWHIDRGRDAGPFANPAHFLILFGLAGIVLGGILACALADDRIPSSAFTIRGLRMPVGGLMLLLTGGVAVAGFPVDDVWHRLFGQDVTMWGPTHIMMIGGASLSAIAVHVLLAEGRRVNGDSTGRMPGWLARLDAISLGGMLLLGMSALQGEFDFGVPQFNALFHPVLIALAAGVALVAIRVIGGRGAALATALFFLVFRLGMAVLVGPILGRSWLSFPLYLVEALVVEAIALRVPRTRPITFGALCGLGIGTIGFASEWVWTQFAMPLPWQASLMPDALVLTIVAGVSGGLLGGMLGRALSPPDVVRQPTPRFVGALAWAGAIGCLAFPLPVHSNHAPAAIALEPAGNGTAYVEVTLDPELARDTNWFEVMSWQGAGDGRGGLERAHLHEVSPGHYRSEKPMPVSGAWKTVVRFQKGRLYQGIPVYLPADDAIPAPAVPAISRTTTFSYEKTYLQREAVTTMPGLQKAAYRVLAVLALAWLLGVGYGVRRLDRAVSPPRDNDVSGSSPPRERVGLSSSA